MKKLLILPAALLLLTGCSKTEITTCKLESNNTADGYKTSTNYTIESKKGYVTKIEFEDVTTSDNETVLNNLKELVESSYASSKKNYGGFEYSVSLDGGKLTSKVTMDFDVLNLDKYVKDNTSSFKSKYIEDGKLTLEGATTLYESYGATCTKK